MLDASYNARSLLDLVRSLGTRLHRADRRLVLVVPPHRGSSVFFGSEAFEQASKYVDHFSLMTYDYSTAGAAGPNAPIKWCAEAVERVARSADLKSKVLMGLNFYGNDYVQGRSGAATVLGRDLVARLTTRSNRQMQFEWSPVFAEHSLAYVDEAGAAHTVYYPSPKSIAQRIELAQRMGAGISIWEIGQGLDYFYELL